MNKLTAAAFGAAFLLSPPAMAETVLKCTYTNGVAGKFSMVGTETSITVDRTAGTIRFMRGEWFPFRISSVLSSNVIIQALRQRENDGAWESIKLNALTGKVEWFGVKDDAYIVLACAPAKPMF